MGLFATNFGEAWRMAVGSGDSWRLLLAGEHLHQPGHVSFQHARRTGLHHGSQDVHEGTLPVRDGVSADAHQTVHGDVQADV